MHPGPDIQDYKTSWGLTWRAQYSENQIQNEDHFLPLPARCLRSSCPCADGVYRRTCFWLDASSWLNRRCRARLCCMRSFQICLFIEYSSSLLQLQDGLTNFQDVSVVIGIMTGNSGGGEVLGDMLYAGSFAPARHESTKPAYQNIVRRRSGSYIEMRTNMKRRR